MTVLIIILSICLTAVLAALLAATIFDEGMLFLCSLLAVVLAFFLGLLIGRGNTSDEPTAMDVYRGQTTLSITYKDTVPMDTVVVFK